jgi:hypothetical protein
MMRRRDSAARRPTRPRAQRLSVSGDGLGLGSGRVLARRPPRRGGFAADPHHAAEAHLAWSQAELLNLVVGRLRDAV